MTCWFKTGRDEKVKKKERNKAQACGSWPLDFDLFGLWPLAFLPVSSHVQADDLVHKDVVGEFGLVVAVVV